MRISAKEIEIATDGRIIAGEAGTIACGVSTDTRADCGGKLFIPLIGDNYDGHNYIMQAVEKKASIVLTSRGDGGGESRDSSNTRVGGGGDAAVLNIPVGVTVIRVNDTLSALGKLAAWYRLKFSPLVVAVTGSVGKTTTKEMVALVLAKKFNVLKSVGNYNNDIGLPLTLFELNETHTALVVEMGMNNPGEIEKLSKIARPDIAIITNIGYAHIEQLGTRQNILKAKLEIVEGMSKNGTVYMNGDDTMLKGLIGLIDRTIVYYGIDDGLDVVGMATRIKGEHGIEFEFVWQHQNYAVSLDAPGEHNIRNALAAVAVGLQNSVSPKSIVEALAEFKPVDMRMNITESGGIKLINDTYNANVQSMKAALDVLANIEVTGRRVAVLGDMLELGNYSLELHGEVGAYAAQKGVDLLIAVGRFAEAVIAGAMSGGTVIADAESDPAVSDSDTVSDGDAAVSGGTVHGSSDGSTRVPECHAFPKRESAERMLAENLRSGDAVLVKGSRGMHMERTVEAIFNLGTL